jgi:outer membrane protein assembly factor BamB
VKVGKEHGGPGRYITREAWDAAYRTIAKPSALIAARLDPGTRQPRELWRYEKSFVGVVPSPILIDGILYIIRNGGILTSFDAETGAVVKAARVDGAVDPYSASPVSAEGRICIASERGNVAVVEAGKEWKVLAVNTLDEPMYATPALSAGRIYVHTASALYCFGGAK